MRSWEPGTGADGRACVPRRNGGSVQGRAHGQGVVGRCLEQHRGPFPAEEPPIAGHSSLQGRTQGRQTEHESLRLVSPTAARAINCPKAAAGREQGHASLGQAPFRGAGLGPPSPLHGLPSSLCLPASPLLWAPPSPPFSHHWFPNAKDGPKSWGLCIQPHAGRPGHTPPPQGPGGLHAFEQAASSTWCPVPTPHL